MSESFLFVSFQKNVQKNVPKNMILVKKNLNKSLVFCANERLAQKTSNSLIYHEQPDRIALLTWATWAINIYCNHSFVLSNLSKWLTVTHLIWAIWANERMSEWANSQPWCQRSFFSSGTQYPQSRWLHGHIDNDYVAMEIDNKFVTFMEQLREKSTGVYFHVQ